MKSKFSLRCKAIISTIFILNALPATAATIIDTTTLTTSGGVSLVFSQNPLGQSFTLTQDIDNVIIGGLFRDVNPSLNPTLDLAISIVSGAGTNGALLGSKSFTLADGFGGFGGALYTEDFSFLGTLFAGTYTAVFSSTGGRGGMRYINNDPYADGTIYNTDGTFSIPGSTNADLAFLVQGDISPIPVPAAAWLFGSGLIGLIGLARRKKA